MGGAGAPPGSAAPASLRGPLHALSAPGPRRALPLPQPNFGAASTPGVGGTAAMPLQVPGPPAFPVGSYGSGGRGSSCVCSTGPSRPGVGEQVLRPRGSGSRGPARAVNTPGLTRLRGALSAPVPGGAAGAPARVGDVQPEGTRFGTVPWAQLC